MIENQFITVGEWNFGSAISMVMAVLMMVMMMGVRKMEEEIEEGRKKNHEKREKTVWKRTHDFDDSVFLLANHLYDRLFL